LKFSIRPNWIYSMVSIFMRGSNLGSGNISWTTSIPISNCFFNLQVSTSSLTGPIIGFFSKRFPFAIYYTLSNDTVLIHAVVDCRRDPAWLKGKLGL
jgi:hypothetical protein